jgi:hypothetical protein
MSSSFNIKNGGKVSSSDLTRLRRQTAELAAYATYTAAGNTKKISAQSGTTAGILALNTSAVTVDDSVLVGNTLNPFTGVPVSRPAFPLTFRYIPKYY